MSIESMMPSNYLILCHPLLLLPSIFPSIRVFSIVSALHIQYLSQWLELQHQSFWWIFRIDFLWDWLVGSPCCPRDSLESSPEPQFESITELQRMFKASGMINQITGLRFSSVSMFYCPAPPCCAFLLHCTRWGIFLQPRFWLWPHYLLWPKEYG